VASASFKYCGVDLIISKNLLGSSEAPPTKTPSTLLVDNISLAFFSLTLPPYKILTTLACSPKILVKISRMAVHVFSTIPIVAVLPVPIAQIGS
jgi:hypothetical protein